MERAFEPLQGFDTRSHRTLGQLGLGYGNQPLEFVMAWVAEVGGSEAEIDGNRAAITTLVFQEVHTVLGTDLYIHRSKGMSIERQERVLSVHVRMRDTYQNFTC